MTPTKETQTNCNNLRYKTDCCAKLRNKSTNFLANQNQTLINQMLFLLLINSCDAIFHFQVIYGDYKLDRQSFHLEKCEKYTLLVFFAGDHMHSK